MEVKKWGSWTRGLGSHENGVEQGVELKGGEGIMGSGTRGVGGHKEVK